MLFQMNELRKALLTSGASSGGPLIPEDLEPVLVELLYKLAPVVALIPKGRANGKTHEFNRRTGVPAAWFEGELTDPSGRSSTYGRSTVQLKILRNPGGVSGFQQAASAKFIDALESEQLGCVEGMADLIEYAVLWGAANDLGFTGDSYQFSGLNSYVYDDTYAQANNVFDLNAVITLTDLDNMLDAAMGFRGVQRDPKAFIASSTMISKISGLQTKVQRDVPTLEFEGGFVMSTYRGVPLLPSDFVKPVSTTTSPDVSATGSTSGGSLAAATYYYRLASVTMYGEQIVGGEASGTVASGTSGSVALSWTADTNARLYYVYRGTSAGADNLRLIDIIAAEAYDATGAVTGDITTYTDTGAKAAKANVRPLQAGEEHVLLLNLNRNRGSEIEGLLSQLGEPLDEMMRYIELATRKSAYEFILESFMALKVPWARLHAVARRARVA